MKLFHLKNNRAAAVTDTPLPWNYAGNYPEFKDKTHFRSWCADEKTDHFFFSGIEGLNGGLRVNKEQNPPYRIHALVADYDASVKREERVRLIERSLPDAKPRAIASSFSGNARVVWELEEAVTISSDIWPEFLKGIAKALKLSAVAAGFDEAFFNPAMYLECGVDWEVYDVPPVPKALVEQVLFNVVKKIKPAGGDVVIPLEIVGAEVERQFPGAWKGEFVQGARGTRFWVDRTFTALTTVVLEHGLWDFVENKLTPWATILGKKFTDSYEQGKIEAFSTDTYWDGKDYWTKDNLVWRKYSKEDLTIRLRVVGGFHSEKHGAPASEVDTVLYHLQSQKRIDGALPMCHHPEFVRRGTEVILNTSCVRLVEPNGSGVWGEGFPWMASFMQGFLATPEQTDHLMAWLKRYYITCLEKDPQKGQTVFICGGAESGKTLFSTRIIGGLMGGQVDATSFFFGESDFNAHVFTAPVWTVDDPTPSTNYTKKTEFSSLVKRMTANTQILFHEKNRTPVMTQWTGRLVVTMNSDAVSIQNLPDIEASILDKIMLFRAADRKFPFPGAQEINKILAEELPAFGAWLVNWEVPETIAAKGRYGVRSYHDGEVQEAAMHNSSMASFMESLSDYMDDWFEENKGMTAWIGRTSSLLFEASENGVHKGNFKEYRNREFSHQLRRLHAMEAWSSDYRVDYQRDPNGKGGMWAISLKGHKIKWPEPRRYTRPPIPVDETTTVDRFP